MFNCCSNWRKNNMQNNFEYFFDKGEYGQNLRDNDDYWNSNKWFDECWSNNWINRQNSIIVCHCKRVFGHDRDDNFDYNRNNRCRRRKCNFCNLFRF